MNVAVNNFDTGYNTNLHPPNSNMTKFQKVPYYCGMKILNHLPANMKSLTSDLERFIIAL
jgi:hypothetical protein